MKGMQVLGSANLSDGIYRFKAKDQKASIVRTIMFGVNQANPHSRKVEMPKFGDSKVISASQLKKLAIYVHQLGGGE
jgi:cytochrome c oxidase cbb3-type subunit 3